MKDTVDRLTQYVLKHDYIYHALGTSEISDAEYDKAFAKLVELEIKYPEYKNPNSPTNKIGATPPTDNTCIHANKMYSISNVFTLQELRKWIDTLQLSPEETLYANLKADGLAIKLTYSNGELVRGCTRGDGSVGTDVTNHVYRIHNIPKVTHIKETYDVDGEVVIMPTEFNKLNVIREKCGKQIYATPRNAVAGIMNLTSSRAVYNLRFMAYGSSLTGYETYDDLMSDIGGEFSFETLDYTISKPTELENIIKFYNKYNKNMDINNKWEHEDIPGDGIVIRVNSLATQAALGYTDKYPRYSKAWKFTDISKETQIVDIDHQVGRTGAITPIARLEPVYLDGVKITNANLYNESNILSNQYFVGNIVKVVRSGGVIPNIVGYVSTTAKTVPYQKLSTCPSCGAELITKATKEARATRCCINPSCIGVWHAKLCYFVSRKGLNILGYGPVVLRKLLELKLISDRADLLNLTTEQLTNVVGIDVATKLVRRAQKVREKSTLFDIIQAIGIPGLSRVDASAWTEYVTDHNTNLDSIKMLIEVGLDIPTLSRIVKSKISVEVINAYLINGGNVELTRIVTPSSV